MYLCVTVPSVPRDFEVTLTQEDPPVAALTWRKPADLHGQLLGYRLTYGSLAADFVVADQRLLEPDKLRFTTGFLGQSPKVTYTQNFSLYTGHHHHHYHHHNSYTARFIKYIRTTVHYNGP